MKKLYMVKFLLSTLLLLPFGLANAEVTVNVINTMPASPYVADSSINAAFLQQISDRPDLAQLNVGVSTRDGTVILTGTLPSEALAAKIIALADSITGVKDVDASQLTLTGGKIISNDVLLNSKVIGTLIRGQAFPGATIEKLPIKVTTNRGIVYLKGIVDTQAQMIYAIKLAQGVPGVPRVISELAVKQSSVQLP